MAFDHPRHFLHQADWATRLGSPFTAALLTRGARDFDRIAPLFTFRDDWRPHDAAPLRFAGGLNAAVISDRAPALAALYPEPGRAWNMDAVWAEALRTIEADSAWLMEFMRQAPQTNETRRTLALLPAFLRLSRHGPLHMREVGASAGLNMHWDRFGYRTQTWSFGAAAGCLIDTEWRGDAPDLAAAPSVATRAGCDVHPLDIRDEAATQRLKSYIWPDQFERVARFESAAEIARANYVGVARADAADWLERQLAGDLPEGVTVIYHSVAWQYFPADTDARGRAAIHAAGARATPQRRLAWVRFEHDKFLGYPGDGYTIDMALWPGDGAFTPIAKADPHVRWVELL